MCLWWGEWGVPKILVVGSLDLMMGSTQQKLKNQMDGHYQNVWKLVNK